MEINAEGGGGQKALAYFYSEMDFSVPESLHATSYKFIDLCKSPFQFCR